jgi:hypothetical protein
MKRKIASAMLMILMNLLSNYLIAQSDIKDFIIDQSGTIISGEVIKPLDPRRYKVLVFSDDKGVKSTFVPGEIQGFVLANGARYRSGIHPDSGENVFFEEIIIGDRSLLAHNSHLFIELDEGLKRLEFRTKKDVEMKQVRTESFGYIGVLTYGLGPDMEYSFVESIRSVPPRKGAITELFKQYHELKGVEYQEFGAEYPFLKISPNIGVGYYNMFQSVNGTRATVHPVSSSIGINALVDFHFLRDAPRFFITSGLIFQKFQTIMDINIPVMGGRFNIYEDFDLNSVGLPLLFNYYLFGNKRIKVHPGIGMNFRVLNKTTNESFTEARRENGTLISTYPFQQLQVGNNIGLLVRLGVTTQITSKTALVLEGQVHRMPSFGEIFANAPSGQGSGWYKYNLNGYSLNAAVKF